MKIIGFGNALVDVLARLESDLTLSEMNLPKASMQLINDERLKVVNNFFAQLDTHLATGGSAGNTILALANLGDAPGYIGKVGRDAMGDFFADNCRARGIDAHLLRSDIPSGTAYTFISPDGERTFATYLGAAATMQAEELSSDMLTGYRYLYIEGYVVQDHALIERAMQLGKEAGMVVCLDFASYNIVESEREFLLYLINEFVDIIFANEEEAQRFTDLPARDAVGVLAQHCSLAVVKLGAEGAIAQRGTERCEVPAVAVPTVVDTTGAGDYFAAGFLHGLTHGASLKACAEMGALLGAAVIQVVGATLDEKTWEELLEAVSRK